MPTTGGGGSTNSASETVAGIAEIATQTETDAGTDNARIVTPAKLANYSGLGTPDATETTKGKAELATQAETDTGTDDTRIVTPLKLAGRTATDTRAGVVELATDTEAQTGTDTARAVTPANLSARSATETRTGVVELATDAETQTGTDTARAVTPANLTARSATETRTGVVELATDAEAQTGTDTARAITPANLTARSATETRAGIAELATQTETNTGTDDARIVTPLKLKTVADTKASAYSTFIEGLNLVWNSGTSITVTAGSAWVPGASRIVSLASDTTLTSGTSFTLGANKWYYVYLTDTGTITVVRDDGTNPYPVAYRDFAKQQTSNTNRRYIGALLCNTGGTAIFKFSDRGGRRYWMENVGVVPFRVIAAGGATTSSIVPCAGAVPTSSRQAVVFPANVGGAGVYLYLGHADLNVTLTTTSASSVVPPGTTVERNMILNSSGNFNYLVTSGAPAYVDVAGYIEER